MNDEEDLRGMLHRSDIGYCCNTSVLRHIGILITPCTKCAFSYNVNNMCNVLYLQHNTNKTFE